MINKEVIPAFDMLLEELERIIPELSQQGKLLMDQKKFGEAHNIINKAQSVVSFQEKVKALREEWLLLDVPATAKATPKPKKPGKSKRTPGEKLEQGLRTPNSAFHMPILQVLVNLGGSTKTRQVYAALEKEMKDILNTYDWECLTDGKTIRWKNNVGWAKAPLLEAGYLSNTAPKGTWEITEAGRKALEDSKKK